MPDIDPNEPTTTEELIETLDAELGESSDEAVPEAVEGDTTAVDPTPIPPPPPAETEPASPDAHDPESPTVDPDPEPPADEAPIQPGDAELVGSVKDAEEEIDFMVECDVKSVLFDFVDEMAAAYQFTGKQHKRARDLAEEKAKSLVLLGG